MADQKTMRTGCLGGISIIWVPKLLLTPLKIRIFGPKTVKFGPKYAFLVIFGQILAFFALFFNARYASPLGTMCKKHYF